MDVSPAFLLLPAAALAWMTSLRRPGSVAAVLRAAGVAVPSVTALPLAIVLGMAIDPFTRRGLLGGAGQQLLVALRPLGEWFVGPMLPRDLWMALPLLAVVALDAWRPAWLRPPTAGWSLSAAPRRATATGRRLAKWLLCIPLIWGWSDVLATTGGQRAQALYAALVRAGVPVPGPLTSEPDLRLPAAVCWIAAGVLVANLTPGRGRSALSVAAALSLVGGLVSALARDVAVSLALPVVLAAAFVSAREALRRRTPDRHGDPAGRHLTRLALASILLLALWLRWTPRLLGEPASDSRGYYETAVHFHERVASERTNPIALAYLNIHPASREPLFPLLVRLSLDVLGESLLHMRYLTVAAALGVVALTYAFGRAALGVCAGLGAALLVAVLPWHIVASQEGLREEVAACLVYGLATLVVVRRQGGLLTAVGAGVLAAAATLTRLDAGAVVMFLLVVWGLSLGRHWRRSVASWAIFVILLAPLLAGYQLKSGDALAPMGTSMGGDIRAAIQPLVTLEYSLGAVLRYFAAGTVEVYANTIFGSDAEYLPAALRRPAVGIALLCLMAGALVLLRRGPRLPVALATVGAYVPPFAFIAGIGIIGGPGGGYAERYTYLILPAVLAVTCWAAGEFVSWARQWVESGRARVGFEAWRESKALQ